jgi:peptidoglycan hydrolase-like protein with peptidoglycan-binding domain
MDARKWTYAFTLGLLAATTAFAQQFGNGLSPSQDIQAASGVSSQALSQEDVRKVQSSLNEAGFQAGPVDGIWGPQTAGALRNFQQARGLEASGQLDDQTILALGFSREEFAAAEVATPSQLSEADIRRVQETLKSEGYDVGAVDGVWGPNTEDALRAFQQAKGIPATGRLNEDTVLALGFSTSEFAAGEFSGDTEQRNDPRR